MDNPCLYTVQVSVEKDGTVQDDKSARIGFRTVECRPDGFFFKREKAQADGLNRHQSYPYIGYAAPARVQKKDADILKNYLHLTVVRTSHYMQAEEFWIAAMSWASCLFRDTRLGLYWRRKIQRSELSRCA